MEREKGVTTAPCYSCGAPLPTTERPDGSRAAVPCDCAAPEVALTPAPMFDREFGLAPGDDEEVEQ